VTFHAVGVIGPINVVYNARSVIYFGLVCSLFRLQMIDECVEAMIIPDEVAVMCEWL
jgi:hypothetical protein